jgi:hypothetical protein
MKALVRTNRYLANPSLRGKILARNAAASAKIEGVSGAKERIGRLLRTNSAKRASSKRA